MLKLMEKYSVFPAISTYNVRIQSLCKLKRSSEAKALLGGMVCNGRKPNSVSYACLIHGFCKEGDLEAVQVHEEERVLARGGVLFYARAFSVSRW